MTDLKKKVRIEAIYPFCTFYREQYPCLEIGYHNREDETTFLMPSLFAILIVHMYATAYYNTDRNFHYISICRHWEGGGPRNWKLCPEIIYII
jgi:hypothetical protein